MLKITTLRCNGLACILKLEGRLMADWVDELHATCRAAGASSRLLGLDLSGLSFADQPGSSALRELILQGASLTCVTPLMLELLELDDTKVQRP